MHFQNLTLIWHFLLFLGCFWGSFQFDWNLSCLTVFCRCRNPNHSYYYLYGRRCCVHHRSTLDFSKAHHQGASGSGSGGEGRSHCSHFHYSLSSSSGQQVWLLTQLYSVNFFLKTSIFLQDKLMTPHRRGHSSVSLLKANPPCSLGPLKGFFEMTQQPSKAVIVIS